jgi:dihydrofolate reductase
MKLVALEWMSLDGVVQAPIYPDEDQSGGFVHGGWHARFFDDASTKWVVDSVTAADAYLFGRGTYDYFAGYWPKAGSAEQILAVPLKTRPKYVATSRPLDPAWTNAHHLDGDIAASVASLKAVGQGTLALIGSPGLAQSLFAVDLIDELRLMIDPLIIGSGKRLFGDTEQPLRFDLGASQPTSTGALLATYVRGGT